MKHVDRDDLIAEDDQRVDTIPSPIEVAMPTMRSDIVNDDEIVKCVDAPVEESVSVDATTYDDIFVQFQSQMILWISVTMPMLISCWARRTQWQILRN